MAKSKKKITGKKPMSEGMAIALIVFGLTAGGIVAYYLLKWVLGVFFPDWIG